MWRDLFGKLFSRNFGYSKNVERSENHCEMFEVLGDFFTGIIRGGIAGGEVTMNKITKNLI